MLIQKQKLKNTRWDLNHDLLQQYILTVGPTGKNVTEQKKKLMWSSDLINIDGRSHFYHSTTHPLSHPSAH